MKRWQQLLAAAAGDVEKKAAEPLLCGGKRWPTISDDPARVGEAQ